jgi:PAS domain-containing protein
MEAMPVVENDSSIRASVASDQQQVVDQMNIATMSDSQFSQSLDALIDISYDGADGLSPSPPPVTTEDGPLALGGKEEFESNNSNASEENVASSALNMSSSSFATPEPTNIFQSASAPSSFVLPIPQGGVYDQSAFFAAAGSFVPMNLTQPFAMPNALGMFAQPPMGGNNPHSFPAAALSYFPYGAMTSASQVAPLQVCSASSSLMESSNRKRGHTGVSSTFPISEDESELKKRKADRNAREQQRAQQVTDQIAHLREILELSGVSLSKTDKFSTLLAVEDYITSLQAKAMELTSEHEKLLSTIQQTTEYVNRHYIATSTVPPSTSISGSEESRAQESSDQDEESENDSLFHQGINYKWIFDCCPFAVAVASIDGRFIDCNSEFQELTGYSRAELLPLGKDNDVMALPLTDALVTKKKRNMSIFNVLHRECIERLFCAMSKVLQRSKEDDGTADESDESICGDTITHEVNLCKRTNRKVCLFFIAVCFRLFLIIWF